MSSASLQSLADDALSVLAPDDEHAHLEEEDGEEHEHDHQEQEQQHARYATEREYEEQRQFERQQEQEQPQAHHTQVHDPNPHAAEPHEHQAPSNSSHTELPPAHRSPLSPSRSSFSYPNDAVAPVADAYSNLPLRGGRSATPPQPLGSDSNAASASASSLAAAASSAAAAAHADALASPQPVRPAPRPHSQQHPQRPSSLDDQFEQSRLQQQRQQQQQRGGAGGSNNFDSTASERTLPSPPVAQPARPMSFSQGRPGSAAGPSAPQQPWPSALSASQPHSRPHAHAPPLRPAVPPAAILAAQLNSAVGRARWAEQKRFLLTRLGHALRNKGAEVSRRTHALHTDQPACERQLLATLTAYVARTERTLQGYAGEIGAILARVDRCAHTLEAEVRRWDSAAATAGADAGEQSAQCFAQVAHELEEQLQSILSAVAARDNFKLDGGSGLTAGGGSGGGSGSSGPGEPSSVHPLPAFDPFQVARVRALVAENARLVARVNELQLGTAQVVDVGAASASTAASGTGSALVLASASSRTDGPSPSGGLGARQLVSLHETQGIILSLQSQVEQLSSAHATLQSTHERLVAEHASVVATLRHERVESRGGMAGLGERAAVLEGSLRRGEKDSQALRRALQEKTHEAAAASAALAALEATSASAALAAQKAQNERGDELTSLRAQRAREFEQHVSEVKALHAQMESAQQDHAAALQKLRTEVEQHAKQALHQTASEWRAEKDALELRLRDAQSMLERLRTEAFSERRKALAEFERQLSAESAAHAASKNAASVALASAQRECAARVSEVESLRQALADLRGKGEARASGDAASVAQVRRALEEETTRGQQAARELVAARNELKEALRAGEQLREEGASLRGHVAQLEAQLAHVQSESRAASRALAALQTQHAELGRKRSEEQQIAKEAASVAATQLTKLQGAELALELATTREADLVRSGETAAAQASLRESALLQQVRQLEERAAAERREWGEARVALEAQAAALGSSLRSAESEASLAREQAQKDLARFAQLQQASSDSSRSDTERARAHLEVQLEVAMTRFIGTHSARLNHLAKAIGEHAAVAANLGLWASDAAGAEEAAAVTTALRQAVQPPSLSPFDGPVHSEHKSGADGGVSGVGSVLSLAPQSLPAARIHFEGLVSQVESLLMLLLSNAQEGKRRAGDRYQSMIAQLKRQTRDQIAAVERDAQKRLDFVRAQCASEALATQRGLEAQLSQLRAEKEATDARVTSEHAAVEAQLAHMRSEKESVESRAAAEDLAAREALESHTASFESHLAQEREAASVHYGALLSRAEEDAERERLGWDSERALLERRLAELETAAAESNAAWETKLAGSEQEAQERLQSLRDADEVHKLQMREQADKHRQALQDSLALFERKSALELDLVREESRGALERSERDAARQIECMERAHKDAMDAAQLRYVAQLESLQTEHEAALEEAQERLRCAVEAHADQEAHWRVQHDAALAVAAEMAQTQLHSLREENHRAMENLQEVHEEELALAQERSLQSVRDILLGGGHSDAAAIRVNVALDRSRAERGRCGSEENGSLDRSSTEPRGAHHEQQQQHAQRASRDHQEPDRDGRREGGHGYGHGRIQQRGAAPAPMEPRAARDEHGHDGGGSSSDSDSDNHHHAEQEPVRDAHSDADPLVTHRSHSSDQSDESEALSSVPSSASALAHRTAQAEAAALVAAATGANAGAGAGALASSSGRPRPQAHAHRSISPGNSPSESGPSGSPASAIAAGQLGLDPGQGQAQGQGRGPSNGSNNSASAGGALVPHSPSQALARVRGRNPSSTSGSLAARHDTQLAALQYSVQQAARATAARVEQLQLQLEQQARDKERIVAEMEERHESDVAELRSTLAMAKSQLEETQAQLVHHKSHAASLSERWKALSEAHDQAQSMHAAQQAQWAHQRDEAERMALEWRQQMERQLEEAHRAQAGTEAAMATAAEESASARQDLVSAHNGERKRWESLLQSRGEEAALAHQAALAEVEASHQRVLALQRQEAQQALEAALRDSEAQHVQERSQLSSLRSQLSTALSRVDELHAQLTAQDLQMHELHRAHLDDLRARMDQWRDARRAEVEEQERWLVDKMDAIKSNQMRREEALCKSCRQKLGSTSFRAALNRLCDEAVHFDHYRTLHSTPSFSAAAATKQTEQAEASTHVAAAAATPMAARPASSAIPTAATPATSMPAPAPMTGMSTASSVRVSRNGSGHINTRGSGSVTPAFEDSPGALTAKYTSRAGAASGVGSSAPHDPSPPLLETRLSVAPGVAMGEVDALLAIDDGYDERDFDGGEHESAELDFGSPPSARVYAPSHAAPAPAPASGGSSQVDSRRGSVHSYASGSSTPLSRQEGVLTLRFHAPTPAVAEQPESLVHASASFTPAAAGAHADAASLPPVHTPASGLLHSSRSRGSIPPFVSQSVAGAAATPASRSSKPASPVMRAHAPPTSGAVASAHSLDMYLSKYNL